MDVLPEFVDMANTPEEMEEEKENNGMGSYSPPLYPYGLCISLTEKELAKLDLDDDVDVGDMVHLHALGKVTSVSKRDTEDGMCCRVEIQLTHIAAEDEDDENEEAEESMEDKYQPGLRRPY